jgi:peptidyl-prolyl cis-trans isomerase B (cyclophilin B)
VSGKQHKRELRQQKEAAKAAIRRQERQRTIVTAIVIAVVVALGCVLVFLSLDPPAQQTKQSASATAHSEASVACGAAQPSNAGTVRPVFPGGPTQVMELGKDYRAVIQTSCGRVVVDLYEHTTPVTVNNFLFLAQHKFFDGLQIFRNAKTIGALQTGSGTNNAAWDVGYTIPDELKAAQSEGYPAGSVAMANTNTPNSAGSQFFFVYNDMFTAEPTYAKFGKVVEGLDVLKKIGVIPVDGETPTQRIWIESIMVESYQTAGSFSRSDRWE